MDKYLSSENVPPVKKMKQATLNFFKSSPSVENPVTAKTKKRKNPSPVSVDSPNKTAKLSKALNTLTDPPNSPSKQTKGCKPPVDKSINDHEVSSSSEADSGSSKTSGGKCCLMERFVCKLPKENQEISSTNDVVDRKAQDKHSDKSNHDCIVLDDDSIQDVAEAGKTSAEKVTVPKPQKQQTEVTETSNKESVTADAEKHVKEESNEETEASTTEESMTREKAAESENKPSTKQEENFDSSVNENSFLSISGATSTPCKLDDSKKEDLDESVNDNSFLSGPDSASTPFKDSKPTPKEDGTVSDAQTPKTPASARRGKKVDLAKKAEKEAQKQKLKEEKELQKSEKKRKLEEEKAEKERIKKEKKEAKDKEKQEIKEKLLKEKEEKERLKEEERKKKEVEKKKKEEERLQKEEEKKKKQAALDAKMEEKRKREEERKQKEEEKQREEEEKKKKAEKAKQAFQSFFIKPKENVTKPVVSKPVQGKFVPFELKKDMHLAPATRRDALSEQTKLTVDQMLENPEKYATTYLEEMKRGMVIPRRTGRILRTNPKPSEDVEVVHDPEALKKVQHKVKLLQFHTDYRPPYYGTWRKAPKLSPRNPWKKDESLFDYEIDSDDEWEEEEPGESLSCSDGEEEKGEKGEEDENEDEEEDGWMVPHGYLSEDEGCNEDDEITPEKLKLQQLAKAKAWEEEQKRKLQAAPLIAVGCFYEHSPSPLMAGDVRLLYEFRGVVISPALPIPTGMFGSPEQETEEPTTPDKGSTTPSQRGCLKKSVPDEAMPDLIRLVHGNTNGIKRLIRDFRVFWLKKETPDSTLQPTTPKEKLDESLQEKEEDTSILNDSVQDTAADAEVKQSEGNKEEKRRDEGYNCSISKRQLDIKINAIAVRDKRAGFHKTCWYVHDAVLKDFGLPDLVCNSLVPSEPVVSIAEEQTAPPVPSVKDQRSIMDFALSKDELAKIESLQPKVESVRKENTQQQQKLAESLLPQSKMPQKDQKSIMEFARSRDELVSKGPQDVDKCVAASPRTAKEAKKTCGQMSIVNFARKDIGKGVLEKSDGKPPAHMEVDPDVIMIDSDDVEMSESNKPAASSSTTTQNLTSVGSDALHMLTNGVSTTKMVQSSVLGAESKNAESSCSHQVKGCTVKVEKLCEDILCPPKQL